MGGILLWTAPAPPPQWPYPPQNYGGKTLQMVGGCTISYTNVTMNYTLNIEMVGTKESSTGTTRYIHKLSGSKVAMDKFRSDIEAANEAEEITNGFIGDNDLLYFYSKEIPSFLKLKRADNGKWYPDESLLKAMDWAAGKYPNLTPSMLLALIQGA
jgi:hypothetical protein